MTSLNRNTVNRYLGRIRGRIVELCELQARGSHPAIPHVLRALSDTTVTPAVPAGEEGLSVFGIRSRNDHIYTSLFPNGVHLILRRLARRSISDRSPSIPKEWRYYDGIVDMNGRWHYRLSPVSTGGDATETIHDRIEAFLGFARKRLMTFHLNASEHFNMYLKECEFRFNNQTEDLYQLLLKQFRERPLS